MVECSAPKTKRVSEPPQDWWADGPVWAVEVLGILAKERAYRAREQECLSRLRGAGVIR